MNSDLIIGGVMVVVAFFGAVFPLYYKVGKLEAKVNSLCKLLNPRRKKNV